MATSRRQPRLRAPRTGTIPQTVTAPDVDMLRIEARKNTRDICILLAAANLVLLQAMQPIFSLQTKSALFVLAIVLMGRAILHYRRKLDRNHIEIWSLNRFAREEAANPERSKAEKYSEVSGAVKPADFGNQGERSAKWLWHMRTSFRMTVRFGVGSLLVAALILLAPLMFGRALSQGEVLAIVAAGFLTGSGLFFAAGYVVVAYLMHPRAFADDFLAKRPGATEADAQSAYSAVNRFRFR